MMLMQGGDLRKAVWQDAKMRTHIFDWDNKGKHVALAVARGLHFLHKNDVIHRFALGSKPLQASFGICSEPVSRIDLQLLPTSVIRHS